jgi:hypothetical protein
VKITATFPRRSVADPAASIGKKARLVIRATSDDNEYHLTEPFPPLPDGDLSYGDGTLVEVEPLDGGKKVRLTVEVRADSMPTHCPDCGFPLNVAFGLCRCAAWPWWAPTEPHHAGDIDAAAALEGLGSHPAP